MSTPPVVIVTGAAGALGSAVAQSLAKRGYRVAAVDSVAHRARTEALVSSLPGGARAFAADLARRDTWTSLLPRLRDEVGAPRGAALIAGTWQGGTPLHEQKDDATWDTLLSANVETARLALRALLPSMIEAKDGSIVVVGSRAVERPWSSAGAADYAATKSALVTLAQAAAAEVLELGVRINAVLPSTIDTPANRAAMPKADASRWVPTERLAAVIAFLLSDDARDVSGAALPVYGRA